MVSININNKNMYLIIAIFIFLVGAGIVVAYNFTPSNPAVMGHTADEIDVIKTNDDGTTETFGLEEYITRVVQEEIGAPEASNCILVYDSLFLNATGGNGKTGVAFRQNDYYYSSGITTIPEECFKDVGCVIKQELYKSGNVLQTVRFYDFYQDSSTGLWRSGGRAAKNGDRTSSNIIPVWNYLYLRDDYYVRGKTEEQSASNFVFIDRNKYYGQKVYICSVADTA